MNITPTSTANKKATGTTPGEPKVELIGKAAANLAGFLVEKDRVPADSKFSVKGLINANGQKMEYSYALLVSGKVFGAYRAIPASKKGKKGVRSKSFGTIKGEIKTFDLETGQTSSEVVKGI